MSESSAMCMRSRKEAQKCINAETQRTTFEDLPTELRLEIYKHFFRSANFTTRKLDTKCPTQSLTVVQTHKATRRDCANLLLVNKTISYEAKQLLVREATFVIPGNPEYLDTSTLGILSQGIRFVEYEWSTKGYRSSLRYIKKICCSGSHALRRLEIVNGPLRWPHLDWLPCFGLESAQEISFSTFLPGSISRVRACVVTIKGARHFSIRGFLTRDIETVQAQLVHLLGAAIPPDAEFILTNTWPKITVQYLSMDM